MKKTNKIQKLLARPASLTPDEQAFVRENNIIVKPPFVITDTDSDHYKTMIRKIAEKNGSQIICLTGPSR